MIILHGNIYSTLTLTLTLKHYTLKMYTPDFTFIKFVIQVEYNS